MLLTHRRQVGAKISWNSMIPSTQHHSWFIHIHDILLRSNISSSTMILILPGSPPHILIVHSAGVVLPITTTTTTTTTMLSMISITTLIYLLLPKLQQASSKDLQSSPSSASTSTSATQHGDADADADHPHPPQYSPTALNCPWTIIHFLAAALIRRGGWGAAAAEQEWVAAPGAGVVLVRHPPASLVLVLVSHITMIHDDVYSAAE